MEVRCCKARVWRQCHLQGPGSWPQAVLHSTNNHYSYIEHLSCAMLSINSPTNSALLWYYEVCFTDRHWGTGSTAAESTITVLLYCLGMQQVLFTTDMISEGQEHSARQESLPTVWLDLAVNSLTSPISSHLIISSPVPTTQHFPVP